MARSSYQGRYTPENKAKYAGDISNISFRSLWERQVFRWCDRNEKVVQWSSEETVIPYKCKTDGRPHRYFVDLKIKYESGRTVLVEIKPRSEMIPPKKTRGKKKETFLMEVMTWAKNQSKWEAAKKYAAERDMAFQVWDEHTLKKIGVQLLTEWRRSK